MFDLWARDTGIITLIAILAIFIILVQILLCFKTSKPLIKLLPAILLAVAVITFYALIFILKDRSAIGYGILAIIAGVLLFCDLLAWGISAITKSCKNTAANKV